MSVVAMENWIIISRILAQKDDGSDVLFTWSNQVFEVLWALALSGTKMVQSANKKKGKTPKM